MKWNKSEKMENTRSAAHGRLSPLIDSINIQIDHHSKDSEYAQDDDFDYDDV